MHLHRMHFRLPRAVGMPRSVRAFANPRIEVMPAELNAMSAGLMSDARRYAARVRTASEASLAFELIFIPPNPPQLADAETGLRIRSGDALVYGAPASDKKACLLLRPGIIVVVKHLIGT